jgi:hypothetical protein
VDRIKAWIANLFWGVIGNALWTWLSGGILLAGGTFMLSWMHSLSPIWCDRGLTALITLGIVLVGSAIETFIRNRVYGQALRVLTDWPLERLANGMLDWKQIRYEQIANKAFLNTEVPLDGKRYIDCTFEHCTFIYEGMAPSEIIGDCKLIRRYPDEVNFILKSSNPVVIAAWQLLFIVTAP